MVARAAQLPASSPIYVPPFPDFSPDHYPWAVRAAEAGLLDGLREMGPDYDFWGEATRGEVCEVPRRTAPVAGGDGWVGRAPRVQRRLSIERDQHDRHAGARGAGAEPGSSPIAPWGAQRGRSRYGTFTNLTASATTYPLAPVAQMLMLPLPVS